MSARFSYPRVAWIGCCVVATALTTAFWIRSRSDVDEFWISLPAKRGLGVISANNCASLAIQQRGDNAETYIVGYSRLKLGHFHNPEASTFLGFSAARDGDLSFVNVPYWFLVAVFAVAPWFRWRFSLRTLIVAMTLVAVGLGVIVWAVR